MNKQIAQRQSDNSKTVQNLRKTIQEQVLFIAQLEQQIASLKVVRN